MLLPGEGSAAAGFSLGKRVYAVRSLQFGWGCRKRFTRFGPSVSVTGGVPEIWSVHPWSGGKWDNWNWG
jgi:hypothetical protein